MTKKRDRTAHSRKLRQDLMIQLRNARQQIDPELLAHARRMIERRAAPERILQTSEKLRIVPLPWACAGEKHGDDNALIVDRQKNMATILRFLEITDGNNALRRRLQGMVSDKS